jgi:hypothetical protein
MKGDSFRRQASLAKDYAARHDLELDDTLTFHDLGVSAYRGKNAETGQLGAFLQAVRVSRDREHGFQRIVSNDFRGS